MVTNSVLQEYYSRIEGLNYTDRDFATTREKIVAKIPEIAGDKWTDFNESDIGLVFIESLAAIKDNLSLYLDNQALECYLYSATQRKNVRSICRSLGYFMKPAIGAVANVKITVNQALSSNLSIPKYTKLIGHRPDGTEVPFLTLQESVISSSLGAGSFITVPVVQGEVYEEAIPYSSIVLNTGEFKLSKKNIAYRSLYITVNGEEWEEVDDVLLEDGYLKQFSVFPNRSDEEVVMFNPGFQRYIDADSEIKVKYYTTLGEQGNVKAGFIESFKDSLGPLVSLAVTNEEAFAGGEDAESIERARQNQNKAINTMWTIVLLEDFSSLALSIPGIIKAKAIDWYTAPDVVNRPYLIKVYVVPSGMNGVSAPLMKRIRDFFEERRTVDKTVEIYEAVYHPIRVTLDVFVSDSNVSLTEIIQKVSNTVKAFFSPYEHEFGEAIFTSNISTAVENCHHKIKSVQVCEPSTFAEVLNSNEFPKLGELVISVKLVTEFRGNVLGIFPTLADLIASVLLPKQGDMYAVGTKNPYTLYVWSGSEWVDSGLIYIIGRAGYGVFQFGRFKVTPDGYLVLEYFGETEFGTNFSINEQGEVVIHNG